MREQISKYRGFLMGLGCLLIIFQHTGMELPKLLGLAKRCGFIQVDVFFLLSGFGLYYSLSKNSNSIDFYKKRLIRIYASYVPFTIIYFAYCIVSSSIDVFDVAGVLFGTSMWMEGKFVFSWFAQAILPYYIIAPLLYKLIVEYSEKKHFLLIFVVFMLAFNLSFIKSYLIIATARFMSFFAGMYISHILSYEEHGETEMFRFRIKGYIGGALGLAVLGIYKAFVEKPFCAYIGDNVYFVFIPLSLIAIGLVSFGSQLAIYLSKNWIGKKAVQFLSYIGRFSFEIYLAQTCIYLWAKYLCKLEGIKITNIYWFVLMVVSVIVGIIIKRFISDPIVQVAKEALFSAKGVEDKNVCN